MANRVYSYQSTGGITIAELARLVPQLVVSVGYSGSALVLVTVDELAKTNLDQAMVTLGYAFVGEVTPADPSPSGSPSPCEATVAVGQFVQWDFANNRFMAALALSTQGPAVAMVVAKPTAATCVVERSGSMVNVTDAGGAALVPGTVYFLSAAVAGKVSSTPPTGAGQLAQRVAMALTSTLLLYDLSSPGTGGSYGAAFPGFNVEVVVPTLVGQRAVFGTIEVQASLAVPAEVNFQVKPSGGVFATVESARVALGLVTSLRVPFWASVRGGDSYRFVRTGIGGIVEDVIAYSFVDGG